jgi:photosystem II stability/assembly factor-like uncharacterized protein
LPDRTIVYAGTVGQSLWKSVDGGLSFVRNSQGAPSECDVRALALHPLNPDHLLLGTETGLFVSRDAAGSWTRAAGPLDGRQVWCLARCPDNPDYLLAGTCPAGIFCSEDGGDTWAELQAPMPERCVNGAPLTPRVTCIIIDPRDGATFAGVEIAGVRRSYDGGATWSTHGDGLSSQDVHGLAAVWNGRRTLIATTNNDVNRSEDDGETWEPLRVGERWPWSYARVCAAPPERPGEVWVGAGNGPPGSQGGLYRTRDAGQTWERLPLPRTANSTIWNLAFHASDPQRVYAASVSGQLYRTLDGGANWRQMLAEFGEVRALAWAPGSE